MSIPSQPHWQCSDDFFQKEHAYETVNLASTPKMNKINLGVHLKNVVVVWLWLTYSSHSLRTQNETWYSTFHTLTPSHGWFLNGNHRNHLFISSTQRSLASSLATLFLLMCKILTIASQTIAYSIDYATYLAIKRLTEIFALLLCITLQLTKWKKKFCYIFWPSFFSFSTEPALLMHRVG